MRYIIPQHDEVVLFAMSLTCILLVTAGLYSARSEIHFQLSTGDDFKMLLILMLLLAGLALSLYHAFVDRAKSLLEKYPMLLFAVIVNAFSGLLSGAYFRCVSQRL